MQEISSVVDLLRRNPHWWSQLISSTYGVKSGTSILDKTWYVGGDDDIPL